MPKSREREPLMVFGINFSEVQHMDSTTADRIVRGAVEDMRRDESFSRDPRRPRHPEESGISPETLKMRFEPRRK